MLSTIHAHTGIRVSALPLAFAIAMQPKRKRVSVAASDSGLGSCVTTARQSNLRRFHFAQLDASVYGSADDQEPDEEPETESDA
jgi:hypothetical protein